MKYILALDQGTTSSRAIVFDHAGSIKAVAQKEFPQIFPQPGWVEHDPNDIWSTQAGVATQALAQAGVSPADIAAIASDKCGVPLGKLSMQDMRTRLDHGFPFPGSAEPWDCPDTRTAFIRA